MFSKKLWLRFFDNSEYQQLKNLGRIEESSKKFKEKYQNKIDEIQDNIERKKSLNFLHSGHLADIINVLPVIKKLAENHTCNLYININKTVKNYYKHPAGKYYLNEKIYKRLEPLLVKQSYINNVQIFDNQEIDVNFDLIRELPINLLFDNASYASILTGVYPDLSSQFLECENHKKLEGYVVIQRTFRYRNHFINYDFLNNYKKLLFIGIKSEYDDLKKTVKNLEFYDCLDFVEMSEIIKSSKFTLGNSSLAFPIAEGLNVPRLLEACPYFPAAQPHGKNAFNFYFQNQFEKLFKYLYSL